MPFHREWIDHICRLVDEAYMRDPLLLDPNSPQVKTRIPLDWRKKYLEERTPEQLREDLIEAFDQIFALKQNNGRLAKALSETRRKLDRANLRFWLVSLLVSPCLGAFIKALIDHWAPVWLH